jgi:elongation factor P
MEGEPYEVTSYAQKVMWRWGSIINVKAKNLISGWTVPRTFSDHDKFEEADIMMKTYEYLYNDGETYFFMDPNSYEQVELNKETLWDTAFFLNDWDKVKLQEFNWNPINVNVESSVTLEVIETPPGEKWDTATGWKKPATLSTGLVVQVPLFIKEWDKINVDSRTKDYLSRA